MLITIRQLHRIMMTARGTQFSTSDRTKIATHARTHIGNSEPLMVLLLAAIMQGYSVNDCILAST